MTSGELACGAQAYQLIRSMVMEAAPNGKVAGHYGKRPTGVVVWEHFYWPGMQSDIRR
jgi:hypothetical protein